MAIYVGRHAPDQRHLLADGLGVAEHQGPGAARSRPHAIAGTATRFDPDKVVPQVLQLFFYPAGTRVPDGNDTDKRGHTDRNSENGKGAAKPVAGQGDERFAKQGLEIHEKTGRK